MFEIFPENNVFKIYMTRAACCHETGKTERKRPVQKTHPNVLRVEMLNNYGHIPVKEAHCHTFYHHQAQKYVHGNTADRNSEQ